jgi:hypothetical protein
VIKWLILGALVLGGVMAPSPGALEELVRSALTLYLIIAGFLVMVLQRRAWEFIRPLLFIGLALLVLPPLFHDLTRNVRIPAQFSLNSPIGPEWLWAPLLALATFVFIRLVLWYRRRPRSAHRQIFRERERVAPHFDFEDDLRG